MAGGPGDGGIEGGRRWHGWWVDDGGGGENDDDGRRLTADRRVLSAFWLDLAAAADTKAEEKNIQAAAVRLETLAQIQPKFIPISLNYGSFSLD